MQKILGNRKMTKIGIHSDLHLELQKAPDTWLTEPLDILVLAGDITKINRVGDFLIQLSDQYPNMEIIFVPGNHEFYGCESMFQSESELSLQIAEYPKIHFLQCSEVTIHDIRFLGCTGWSQMTNLGPN
jgi:predicted phosphodiesterase